MNFLLHRALAQHELGSAKVAVGAMLPDLWRLADRRVRAREPEAPTSPLERGVAHHLEADRWFHRSRVFLTGERATVEALVALEEPKLGRFGHIAWELCLDGAWLRRHALSTALDDLRHDLDPETRSDARELADAHRRTPPDPAEAEAFELRLERVFERLADGEWIAGYRDGEGLAERIGGIRRWLGLPPLRAASRPRLEAVLAARVDAAEEAVDELWTERRAHLEGAA